MSATQQAMVPRSRLLELVTHLREGKPITVPSPANLFSGHSNGIEKELATILAVHRLSTAVHATEDTEAGAILADCLTDMPARALALAFHHLERHWHPTDENGNMVHILPTPAEIRELGFRLLREEHRQAEALQSKIERDRLTADREAHPENYMGLADFAKLVREKNEVAKMPAPILNDPEALAKRKAELQQQKVQLHKEGKL